MALPSLAALPLPAPAPTTSGILELRGALADPLSPPFALTLALLTVAAGLTLARLLYSRVRRLPALLPADGAGDPALTLGRYAARYRLGDASAELLCLRIAELVRGALALRTGLPASRLTTDELLGRVPELLGAGELVALRRLLSFCDRVKFAGHGPDAGEAEWAIETAGELLAGKKEERREVS